jgi:hypothetical protein
MPTNRPRPAPPAGPGARALAERGKRLLEVVRAAQHWARVRRHGGDWPGAEARLLDAVRALERLPPAGDG